MERRFGIVNVSTGQFFHRPTLEIAQGALRGIHEAGQHGFIVDGEAEQVVNATQLPFRIDLERMVLFLGPKVGLNMEAMRAMANAKVPALVVLDRDETGVVALRGATEYAGVDVDASGLLVVDGVVIERETLKLLQDEAGKALRSYIDSGTGILRVTVMPEPVPAPPPLDGIAVPVKGDPSELVAHRPVAVATLGTDKLPAILEDLEVNYRADGLLEELVRPTVPGQADMSHRVMTLGDLIAEAQRASGLSVPEWNELTQDARDAGILATLAALRKAAQENAKAIAAASVATFAGEGAPASVVNGVGSTGALEGSAQLSNETAAASNAAASETPAVPASATGASSPQE